MRGEKNQIFRIIEDPGKGKKFDSEKAAEIEGLILHNKYESVMRTLTI